MDNHRQQSTRVRTKGIDLIWNHVCFSPSQDLILKRKVNKGIGQSWELSRRDYRGAHTWGSQDDLANPKIKLLFGAIMVPCYQTSELQTNPMSSDSMDSKTCSHKDLACLSDVVRKEPTNRAARGAYRYRKIMLTLYLYTHPCRVGSVNLSMLLKGDSPTIFCDCKLEDYNPDCDKVIKGNVSTVLS